MTELVAVSPPTDWLGVVVVVVVVLVIAAVIAYVSHVRRTPGKQWGEDEIDKLAERLHVKLTQAPVVVHVESLEYDGHTFSSQATLDAYKAAKELLEKYKI